MTKSRALIAIVDDEESVRRALQRLLVSAGYDAESFSGGDSFFAFLKTRRPKCVVLDLHMPGMSGFDIQTRLVSEKDRIPVIVITGHDTPQTRQRVLDAGAVEYLRKPVDAQVLLAAIAAAIGSSP